MSGAQDLPRQLEQARQLARLRQLRERTALAALHEADKALLQAEEALERRRAALARLSEERGQLSQRIVHECASDLGRLAAYIGAMTADLDDQIERTEYAMLDDEEALDEARKSRERARQAWLRASAAVNAAETLVTDTRRAHRQAQEAVQEREAEDAASAAHSQRQQQERS